MVYRVQYPVGTRRGYTIYCRRTVNNVLTESVFFRQLLLRVRTKRSASQDAFHTDP